MPLRIERISGMGKSRIRISGELRSEHLDQVKMEIAGGGPRLALDLEEVELIDVEGIHFLNACKAEGITMMHCSPYIRKWMLQEQRRPKARPHKRKKGRASLGD